MGLKKELKPIEAFSDYHIHSIFSDGLNTYDEIVKAAENLNLKEIAITDHSDEYMAAYRAPRLQGFYHASHRWKNMINNIRVIRGLEADLLSSDGTISDLNNYRHGFQFIILSAHREVFKDSFEDITDAYIRAIEKYSDKFNLIGHPCSTYFGSEWDQGINIEKIVQFANEAKIGIEVNGENLIQNKTNLEKLRYVCENAIILYANSDAHTTFEMMEGHKRALEIAISFGRSCKDI
jgi:DNA polymerase (family X)